MIRYMEFVTILSSACGWIFLEYLYLYLMEFVQIKCRVRRKSSSSLRCKCYSVIWSYSWKHSENVFALSLGYRDTVHEYWWKSFLTPIWQGLKWFPCWKHVNTFSKKVSVYILVYKCFILMFAVSSRNDYVHDIKCDIMLWNRKWYCTRNILISLQRCFTVVYYLCRQF